MVIYPNDDIENDIERPKKDLSHLHDRFKEKWKKGFRK